MFAIPAYWTHANESHRQRVEQDSHSCIQNSCHCKMQKKASCSVHHPRMGGHEILKAKGVVCIHRHAHAIWQETWQEEQAHLQPIQNDN